jgi:hypothetical protein
MSIELPDPGMAAAAQHETQAGTPELRTLQHIRTAVIVTAVCAGFFALLTLAALILAIVGVISIDHQLAQLNSGAGTSQSCSNNPYSPLPAC